MQYLEYLSVYTFLFLKTSKSEWMLDNIRIEKVISAPILLEVLALLDVRYRPNLLSCATSRKTNDATRKWQKT